MLFGIAWFGGTAFGALALGVIRFGTFVREAAGARDRGGCRCFFAAPAGPGGALRCAFTAGLPRETAGGKPRVSPGAVRMGGATAGGVNAGRTGAAESNRARGTS